ncbi:type II toxin-antitoxin system VapC family toxin [Fimbriimonas ginsengisoli]|uniref:Ribonuclease VapC n=1 Tax=Fimbriimonas ginsengisoli Gsoil 348 TaxID=661478 RepID=A0A068NLX3_FIMGI|nr:PIN domain-containing protein [Fimbriimonas ginsengisoli]AIE84417.1 hypothetical protein OP10G_1049 [Fimbriimonas ginsengisoli Gsoil 348]
MTHLLDTSGALAALLNEAGAERVKAILLDAKNSVGISALTLFEIDTAVFHQTGSREAADRAVQGIQEAVAEVIPFTESIVHLARDLRHAATARIATVDTLIAATAVDRRAVLVHRDPHFATLPADRPAQEMLPSKR